MGILKYLITIGILLVLLLGLLILMPFFVQQEETDLAPINVPAPTEFYLTDPIRPIIFDLKYDKYLIPEPYQYESGGQLRIFQFEKMIQALDKTELESKKGTLTYIDNYKNRNGMAPSYRGKPVDATGNSRSASAPGYPDLADQSEFTYLSDGTLVRVLEEMENFIKVSTVENEDVYYVPSKYVRTDDPITQLNKAIVVDRNNQNIATFEKRLYGGNMGSEQKVNWTIVSYSLATTGKVGKYHQPTPLGYYYAIEKRERFYYLKDGTSEIEGFAPYAVRFCAGAYVHGIAVAYRYGEDGTRITPGFQEFSSTIGTIPLSHKCVRNYTSHAKFIYDWYIHGETIVVVIE